MEVLKGKLWPITQIFMGTMVNRIIMKREAEWTLASIVTDKLSEEE